ncbi:peptidoglycan-binding domain-containing protein [Azospirillum sp. ST 5-10]|uniref:peptidoglycan-binding domain-containing protein n=1 Tax=unclassified Azospirillum TaxID=2630922 RepID=UPI003F4A2F47
MADGSARHGRATVPAVAAGLLATVWLVAAPVGPAGAQQPTAADIQWAQSILKDKGFKLGRPNGQMTPETRAALSAYQKSVGLPATGQLDQATVDKMMAGRAAKTPSTVGNLAAQKPGGGGPGQASRTPEREVTPRAATRVGDVEATGGDGEVLLGPVVRSPGTGGAQDAVPRAAPSAGVTAATTAGREVPANALSTGDDGFVPANWMRYAVMALLAATVGALGVGWWRSGRAKPIAAAPARAMRAEPGFTERREPTFTPHRDDLVAGRLPPLSAQPRGGRAR